MPERALRLTVLAGGVGGARLVHSLALALPPDTLTAVVNTGDDFTHLGLRICPDLDTILYTLAGLAHIERGWGLAVETHEAMSMATRLGHEPWFQLSDTDLGTHLQRTELLRQGLPLHEITRRFLQQLDVPVRLLPMCDEPCPTLIETQEGRTLELQQWLVRERALPRLRAVHHPQTPSPAPGVLDSLQQADVIILAPSNPWVSLLPILRLPGVREAVARRPVIGVSPLIGGAAIKGPLGGMVEDLLQVPASAQAVAELYADLLDLWVVHPGDAWDEANYRVIERPILLPDEAHRRACGRAIVDLARSLCS